MSDRLSFIRALMKRRQLLGSGSERKVLAVRRVELTGGVARLIRGRALEVRIRAASVIDPIHRLVALAVHGCNTKSPPERGRIGCVFTGERT